MDSIPMVIITGQVPTHAIGLDAFRVRHRGHHATCVKHNFLVKDVKDLALTIKKAFYLAKSGEPSLLLESPGSLADRASGTDRLEPASVTTGHSRPSPCAPSST